MKSKLKMILMMVFMVSMFNMVSFADDTFWINLNNFLADLRTKITVVAISGGVIAFIYSSFRMYYSEDQDHIKYKKMQRYAIVGSVLVTGASYIITYAVDFFVTP